MIGLLLLIKLFTTLSWLVLSTSNFIDQDGQPVFDSTTTQSPEIDAAVYPVCANVTWKANNPDIRSTMYDCIDNIADAYLPPSYLNNTNLTEIQIAFALNNLMSVSEIESTVTMDFFFRIYWVDQRLNVPALWDALTEVKPTILTDGIHLEQLIRDDAQPLRIWLPDIYFNNGKELHTMAETIRVRPGGMFFWSRHVVATLQQSLFGKCTCTWCT